MRRSLFAFVTLPILLLGLSLGTAHAVPLLRGFGGPAGFGSNVLPANDDGSTAALDLTGAFPGGLRFFSGTYTQFWVNNNGNITFRGPVFNYTPMAFPISNQPMIAPYWGDVDTRGGSVGGDNLVYWHLEPGRLIVTWHDVGYFASHTDLRMDFQMILTNTLACGSGDFDVEFRYNRCEWTTGDASGGTGGFGGTPAQAGFDAGNLTDYVAMPGSFTMAILDVCTTSNVGTPGVWRFGVRGGTVVCPDAGLPCDIPDGVGPCGIGRTQCVGSDVECQPVTTPSAERCDGVDNDCNGMEDDGDLCDGTDVCVDGVCRPPCFEGGCSDGFTCDADSGICVETACIGVECSAGDRCEEGVCVNACSTVVCPHGRTCIGGRCVDPCASVTCDAGQICRDGICVATCPCLPCPEGGSCNADGSCTPRGCDIVICEDGFYCEDGLCYDACADAVCPTGQMCDNGDCVDIPPPPPPPPADGGMNDAGPMDVDAGPMEMDAGPMEVDAGPPAPMDDGGCGCRVPTSGGFGSRGAGAALFIAVLGVVVGRRRRRARRGGGK